MAIVEAQGIGTDAVAERAVAEVHDGEVVGLGSGRAARAFVRALGRRVARGLRIRGVATSAATAELAATLGIPMTSLEDTPTLDVAIDGADEVAPNLDLIKGLGGALVREMVVAAAARRFVVLVTPEKLVPALGARGTLPVEVVPFALAPVRRRLAAEGLDSDPRMASGRPYVTDNGNVVLDCHVGPIADPVALERRVHSIPGVVGTGLFLGMATLVLVQESDGSVRELRNPAT